MDREIMAKTMTEEVRVWLKSARPFLKFFQVTFDSTAT